MFFIKYICAIIAIFSTLLFFSNMVTNLTSSQIEFVTEDNKTLDNNRNFAAFRIILAVIMSITWPLVFML